MEYEAARERFIQCWGTLGSHWGINRTMAQIHSLLLVTKRPLSAEEVMDMLQISRGNANMNLRALIDWGLVRKEHKSGERKEYFLAEKDVWEMARRVMAERKKREIEPVIRVLDDIQQVEDNPDDPEIAEFKEMTAKLRDFVAKMDRISEKMTKSDRNWFLKVMMKLVK